jgi:acetylornithine deacetylase
MERAFARLLDWIDIPSTSGEEGSYGDALARELVAAGFDVERQELSPGRFNVLARTGAPELVFCTHLDTVPPYYGPREDREFIHGRGSCDAKGQATAMIEAARALLNDGETRIGLLFTVAEETDSAGATGTAQTTVTVAAATSPPPTGGVPGGSSPGGGSGGGALTVPWLAGLVLAVAVLGALRRRD